MALTLTLLNGCWFGNPGSGIVTGVITYGGQPAAGKRVTLVGGESRTVATDTNGRYTFSKVASRKYQISYRSDGPANDSDATEVFPNEIASWRTTSFDIVEGTGREVPPIEVAYNGLLYPERGMALVVSAEAVVPFHWSAHARAQRYRVVVSGENGFKWTGQWEGQPTSIFAQNVSPGRYTWTVEIDGGDAGMGQTRTRQVDMGP